MAVVGGGGASRLREVVKENKVYLSMLVGEEERGIPSATCFNNAGTSSLIKKKVDDNVGERGKRGGGT